MESVSELESDEDFKRRVLRILRNYDTRGMLMSDAMELRAIRLAQRDEAFADAMDQARRAIRKRRRETFGESHPEEIDVDAYNAARRYVNDIHSFQLFGVPNRHGYLPEGVAGVRPPDLTSGDFRAVRQRRGDEGVEELRYGPTGVVVDDPLELHLLGEVEDAYIQRSIRRDIEDIPPRILPRALVPIAPDVLVRSPDDDADDPILRRRPARLDAEVLLPIRNPEELALMQRTRRAARREELNQAAEQRAIRRVERILDDDESELAEAPTIIYLDSDIETSDAEDDSSWEPSD